MFKLSPRSYKEELKFLAFWSYSVVLNLRKRASTTEQYSQMNLCLVLNWIFHKIFAPQIRIFPRSKNSNSNIENVLTNHADYVLSWNFMFTYMCSIKVCAIVQLQWTIIVIVKIERAKRILYL